MTYPLSIFLSGLVTGALDWGDVTFWPMVGWYTAGVFVGSFLAIAFGSKP